MLQNGLCELIRILRQQDFVLFDIQIANARYRKPWSADDSTR